jgi:DNA-binding response OmpR family regulator
MKAHILLIAEPTPLTELVIAELKQEGYRVTVETNGIAGLLAIRNLTPDLLLLDGQASQISSLEICQRLQSTGVILPILLLSNPEDLDKNAELFAAGATDYLLKPFSLQDLLFRIQLHLQRHQVAQLPTVMVFQDLRIDCQRREVRRSGRLVDLTTREFELLEYFMLHPQQVMRRDVILSAVWNYDYFGSSNIIEVYVRNLRLKLEAAGEERLIHTVRGVGYVLREPRIHQWAMSA